MYIIIEESTPAELQRKVNIALKNGYTLVGGVSVSVSNFFPDGMCYSQAMVNESSVGTVRSAPESPRK